MDDNRVIEGHVLQPAPYIVFFGWIGFSPPPETTNRHSLVPVSCISFLVQNDRVQKATRTRGRLRMPIGGARLSLPIGQYNNRGGKRFACLGASEDVKMFPDHLYILRLEASRE